MITFPCSEPEGQDKGVVALMRLEFMDINFNSLRKCRVPRASH